MDVLTKTQKDLNNGQAKLDGIIADLDKEKVYLPLLRAPFLKLSQYFKFNYNLKKKNSYNKKEK